jgi:hypothetical protein
VAALLRRVHPARAQVDGPGRSATRHRYAAQLPLVLVPKTRKATGERRALRISAGKREVTRWRSLRLR